jgi:MSHA biogenesis protein MshI
MSLNFRFLPRRASASKDGWLVVAPRGERVDLAHGVRREGRLHEVTLLESYATGGNLAGALKRLSKEKGLGAYRCSALLQPSDYQILQVEAPNVPPAELRDALRWQVKDMLSFPVEEATLDVLEIPGQHGSGRPRQVMVIVAHNGLLSPIVGAFHHAGLNLEAVDIPDIGQRNLAALVEYEGRATAALTFDQEGGLLTITSQGELYVGRRVDVTWQALAAAETERRDQLFDRIVLEVQRTLDTFDRQYSYVPIGSLMLMAVPEAESLQAALAPNVYVPVEIMDLSRVLDFPAIPELRVIERQAQCLKLIGATLRQ